MKLKFLLSIILIVFCIHSVVAQWDSLPVKTKLIYSFSRGHVITNYSGSKEDVNKIYFTKQDTIVIDTVLKLSGQNRKLIILSKCLNDIVLNKNFKIYDGKINRPDDYDKIYNIIGTPIINKEGLSFAKHQITGIYQYNQAIYLLTLQENFLKEIKYKKQLLSNIDKSLLNARIDTINYGNYMTDVFINSMEKNYPLVSFVCFQNTLKKMSEIDGDFLFEFEADNKGLPFEENPSKIRRKNFFAKNSEKYVDRTNKGEPLKTIYLSKKYGIVHSYSYAHDREHEVTYVNILNLEKVELPVSKY